MRFRQHRQIGAILGFCILLFPFIFSWLTLRQGHTTFSRVLSIVWLTVCIGVTVNVVTRYDFNQQERAIQSNDENIVCLEINNCNNSN